LLNEQTKLEVGILDCVDRFTFESYRKLLVINAVKTENLKNPISKLIEYGNGLVSACKLAYSTSFVKDENIAAKSYYEMDLMVGKFGTTLERLDITHLFKVAGQNVDNILVKLITQTHIGLRSLSYDLVVTIKAAEASANVECVIPRGKSTYRVVSRNQIVNDMQKHVDCLASCLDRLTVAWNNRLKEFLTIKEPPVVSPVVGVKLVGGLQADILFILYKLARPVKTNEITGWIRAAKPNRGPQMQTVSNYLSQKLQPLGYVSLTDDDGYWIALKTGIGHICQHPEFRNLSESYDQLLIDQ
jgi:hypothetical protein